VPAGSPPRSPAGSRPGGGSADHSERSCPIAAPATTNEPRINDRIRAREVRLVSEDGEQIGIRPLPEALGIARDLDLVEVAPNANPPVCRIMDYGKFKYEAAQQAKQSRRKSTAISIKEMKYRVKIGKGDFDTKTAKVEKFLGEGHKVKLTIMFRGREVFHPELGMRILERVAEHNAHLAKIEAAPRLDGRNMTMVLAPDKRVQAEWARRQAEEAAEAGGGNGATAPPAQPDAAAPPTATPQPAPAPATTAQE
jgi:translation initiation factor IF-3